MPMANKGRSKLIEECSELVKELGELIQVLAKQDACHGSNTHFDGSNLKERIEDEMGDVLGAIKFAKFELDLDIERIRDRAYAKYQTFCRWNQDPDS
jgi:NTP pyrophosphatase (non-canonical NTP hydrolase)